MNKSVPKLNIRAQVERMLEVLPERNRTIVMRRYGIVAPPPGFRRRSPEPLGSGARSLRSLAASATGNSRFPTLSRASEAGASLQPETLEAIGRDYNITRERVRQIERASLEKIKNTPHYERLAPIFDQAAEYVSSRGGVVASRQLLHDLAAEQQRAHLSLILALSGPFVSARESDDYHPAWALTHGKAEGAQALVNDVVGELRARNASVSWGELLEIGNKHAEKLGVSPASEVVANYLALSKKISRGPFGTWGLAHWAEINPRGVRDRAYLIFKKEHRPLHFREVASAIDNSVLARRGRKTNPQTVHNELIKDERFVLVGHGLYALVEMGYQKGTVRDVIRRVLQEAAKPLARDEVVKHVLKQRFVQENTIVLNLQNREHFARDEKGRYYLA